MKKIFQISIIIFALHACAFCNSGFSNIIGETIQETDSITPDVNTIRVNAAYVDGKIRIRWTCSDISVWEQAKKTGYTIERITVKSGDTYLSPAARIASYIKLEDAYMPKTLSELQSASSNQNEGTLADRLMNDQSTQDSIDFAGSGTATLAKAVYQKQMRDNRYFFANILAEKNFDMACAMGMAYIDEAIEPNKQYAYIVTLSTPSN